jgi:hypothetical protein
MPSVLKCPFQPNNMLFIFWISLLQLVQDLYFLEASTIPIARISDHVANSKASRTWILDIG